MIKRNATALYALLVLTLVVVGIWGYYLFAYDRDLSGYAAVTHPRSSVDRVYVNLPRIEVNLSGERHRLQLDMTLEITQKNKRAIQGLLPRISERVAAFMMNQKAEDIAPPNAEYALRQVLLDQVNEVTGSTPVSAVVFRRIMVL